MKFRKKPVVIEAEQFHSTGKPLPFRDRGPVVMFDGDEGRYYVQTLEGPLTVSDGDWIICGVKGEFYPVKPDIFEQTYEPVPGREPTDPQ
jgi:hypothetical protein